MQLDLETGAGNRIQSFTGSGLRINNEVLRNDVIVSAERLIPNWAPPPLAELSIADFEPILALDPEVVLLGTGATQNFPPARVMSDVMRLGVGLEVMSTQAACRTYNVLLFEQRRVVAALMLRG